MIIFFLIFSQALYFELKGLKQERCFKINLQVNHQLSGGYSVSGSNDKAYQARIVSPNGRIVHRSERGQSEAEFTVTAEVAGDYQFCIASLDTQPKVISFEFYHQDELDDDEFVMEEQLEPLQFAFTMIKKNLEILNRDILFFAKREEVHRDLIEQTCDRVMWSVLFKMLALSSVTFAQILMMRSFFEGKSSTSV